MCAQAIEFDLCAFCFIRCSGRIGVSLLSFVEIFDGRIILALREKKSFIKITCGIVKINIMLSCKNYRGDCKISLFIIYEIVWHFFKNLYDFLAHFFDNKL